MTISISFPICYNSLLGGVRVLPKPKPENPLPLRAEVPEELESSELLPDPESPGMKDFQASSALPVPEPEPKLGSSRFSMVEVGAAMAILAKARMIVDFMLKRGNYICQRRDLRDRLCKCGIVNEWDYNKTRERNDSFLYT